MEERNLYFFLQKYFTNSFVSDILRLISFITESEVISMLLDENNKSVFLIKYGLLLLVKDRIDVIDEEISEKMKEVFIKTTKGYGITLEEWRCTKNHVEVVFKCVPNKEVKLSSIVNMFKSTSSRYVRKEFPIIREKIEGNSFWEHGYCIVSLGEMNDSLLARFIKKIDESKVDRKVND